MVFILKSKRPRTTLVLNTPFIFRSVVAFFEGSQTLPTFSYKTWQTVYMRNKNFCLFCFTSFSGHRLPRGNRHERDSQVPCKVPWLVGLARRVIHPVESPLFAGRVTLVAGPTFLLVNTWAHSAGSTRSRQDNQSMRERYPRQ